MDLRYDKTIDCAYILLEIGHIVSTRRLPGLRRMVDYDGLGRPLGAERTAGRLDAEGCVRSRWEKEGVARREQRLVGERQHDRRQGAGVGHHRQRDGDEPRGHR